MFVQKIWVLCSVTLFILLGSCQEEQKEKLMGRWYCTHSDTGEVINYYTKIEFRVDSVFLKDENLIEYQAHYQFGEDKIRIGNSAYPMKIVNDTIIKLFNLFFTKERNWSSEFYGQYIPSDIVVQLPNYSINETDSFENISTKSKAYVNDIVVGNTKNNKPVLWQGGQRMPLPALSFYLEEPHSPRNKMREANLFIDKDVSMEFVDSVLKVLDNMGLRSVSFVLSDDRLNENLYPSRQLKSFIPLTPISRDILFDENIIKIYFGEGNNNQQIIKVEKNRVFLNANEIDTSLLFDELKEVFLDEGADKFSIILLYDSNISYETFIKEMLRVESFYHNLWNNESKQLFGKKYKKLSIEEKQAILNKIPKQFFFFSEGTYKKLKEIPVPYCDM